MIISELVVYAGVMCGRFVQAETPEFYGEVFGARVGVAEAIKPSWNVAPTTNVYAVVEYDRDRVLTSFRWGFVPYWATDRTMGNQIINARVETAAQKPMFRESYANCRCLIPLDGFYEWQQRADGKLPHYIHGEDGRPLAAAGLWSSWTDRKSGERLETCAILTGKPNELVEPIHDRMPVIIEEQHWDAWLDPANGSDAVHPLVGVYPASRLVGYPVSTLVNNVYSNTADNIVPLEMPGVGSD